MSATNGKNNVKEMIDGRTLLQVDATVIAGILFFLTDFVPRTDTFSGPCILADATTGAAVAETSTASLTSTSSPIPLEILPMPMPD
jgi:hypothetical protein